MPREAHKSLNDAIHLNDGLCILGTNQWVGKRNKWKSCFNMKLRKNKILSNRQTKYLVLIGRNSSVGRALDWRSKCPWFDPWFRQLFYLLRTIFLYQDYKPLTLWVHCSFLSPFRFTHVIPSEAKLSFNENRVSLRFYPIF